MNQGNERSGDVNPLNAGTAVLTKGQRPGARTGFSTIQNEHR